MSDRLSEIGPRTNESIYHLYQSYEFPCPKPGAQLILGAPFATSVCADAGPDRTIDLVAMAGSKRLEATIWVSLSRPLVAASCRTNGLTPAAYMADTLENRSRSGREKTNTDPRRPPYWDR